MKRLEKWPANTKRARHVYPNHFALRFATGRWIVRFTKKELRIKDDSGKFEEVGGYCSPVSKRIMVSIQHEVPDRNLTLKVLEEVAHAILDGLDVEVDDDDEKNHHLLRQVVVAVAAFMRENPKFVGHVLRNLKIS